jgi:dipeptidase E
MMHNTSMKTLPGKIFIGGGGSPEQSRSLDHEFVLQLNGAKPLIYIPNAMEQRRHRACLKWIKSVMRPFGIIRIEMWNDLRPQLSPTDIAGIYIGGGDTVKLLRELRQSGFSRFLKRALQVGVPIYGGSAGAIVFGDDIRTAPEASKCGKREARGLGLISGYSIACHFDGSRAASFTVAAALTSSIIALPETAGAVVVGRTLRCIGDPITLFMGRRQKMLKVGAEHQLRK